MTKLYTKAIGCFAEARGSKMTCAVCREVWNAGEAPDYCKAQEWEAKRETHAARIEEQERSRTRR